VIYSELKSTFTGILNRRDITPSQIVSFLKMGSQYIHRKLRVPPMEYLIEVTSAGAKYIPVPGDFLQVIALYHDDSTMGRGALVKRDLATVLASAVTIGVPTMYCRVGDSFVLGPTPPSGTKTYIHYYRDTPELVEDTDHNWLTDAAPTLLVYAGLKYAADYYLDDRKPLFLETFNDEMRAVQDMSDTDELSGAAMTPALDVY
jgi:hypothetical protein